MGSIPITRSKNKRYRRRDLPNPCRPMATKPRPSKAKLGDSVAVETALGATSLALADTTGAAWEFMPTSRLKVAIQRLAFSNKEALLTFKTSLRSWAVKSAQTMMRASSSEKRTDHPPDEWLPDTNRASA